MYIDKFDGEETKIYTIKELQDLEPTVADIDYFIESGSLYLSLAVNMFKFCGYSDDDAEILNICRTERDFYRKYTWTKEQRAEYEHIWTAIFKKCLDMQTYEAYHEIAMWSAMGCAFNLVDSSSDYYNEYLKLVKDLETTDDTIHVIGLSH